MIDQNTDLFITQQPKQKLKLSHSRSGEPKQRRKRGDEDLIAAGTWVAIAGYGKAEVLRFSKGRYHVRFEVGAERNMYHHEIKGQETEALE